MLTYVNHIKVKAQDIPVWQTYQCP